MNLFLQALISNLVFASVLALKELGGALTIIFN